MKILECCLALALLPAVVWLRAEGREPVDCEYVPVRKGEFEPAAYIDSPLFDANAIGVLHEADASDPPALYDKEWQDVGSNGRVYVAEYGIGHTTRAVTFVFNKDRSFAQVFAQAHSFYGCRQVVVDKGSFVSVDAVGTVAFVLEIVRADISVPRHETWVGMVVAPDASGGSEKGK